MLPSVLRGVARTLQRASGETRHIHLGNVGGLYSATKEEFGKVIPMEIGL